MKLVRTISFGILIWIIGVTLYTLSFYIPILEDADQQANLWLSIVIVPVVWFASKLYYNKKVTTHGFWTGMIFFITSAILDALITVPLLILPYGGTYFDFFIDFSFWVIGIEFVATVTLYWYLKLGKQTTVINYKK